MKQSAWRTWGSFISVPSLSQIEFYYASKVIRTQSLENTNVEVNVNIKQDEGNIDDDDEFIAFNERK